MRLSLNGPRSEKEELPECYTITGLTAANILETSTPDEFKIPVKTKTIGELTDDDIFTLVSVTNLEIMCKGRRLHQLHTTAIRSRTTSTRSARLPPPAGTWPR